MAHHINKFNSFLLIGTLGILFLLESCGNTPSGSNSETPTEIENTATIKTKGNRFSEDSAFAFIEAQVNFGYRIPGSVEHAKCAQWLYSQLSTYCDTAYFQKGQTQTHTGKNIPVYNLIGSFNPKATKRMLWAAHWDSRPIADQDNERTNMPISGANDGASGVGVLLEIARILDTLPQEIGLDIIFFYAEDLGASEV